MELGGFWHANKIPLSKSPPYTYLVLSLVSLSLSLSLSMRTHKHKYWYSLYFSTDHVRFFATSFPSFAARMRGAGVKHGPMLKAK